MSDRYTVKRALRSVAESGDGEYGVLLDHGSMQLGFYKPHRIDNQRAHDRDEIYVIQSGRGVFFLDGKRQAFEPGEALFVPAGIEHRFEDFSDDFSAWVVFYGPPGGEE
jgi:mannose-6-phosphate isomerase-like protein (cupin superfamily)